MLIFEDRIYHPRGITKDEYIFKLAVESLGWIFVFPNLFTDELLDTPIKGIKDAKRTS